MEFGVRVFRPLVIPAISVGAGAAISLVWAWWSRAQVLHVIHTCDGLGDYPVRFSQNEGIWGGPGVIDATLQLAAPMLTLVCYRTRALSASALAVVPLILCAWYLGAALSSQRYTQGIAPRSYVSQVTLASMWLLCFLSGLCLAAPIALPWHLVSWIICMVGAGLVMVIRAHLPPRSG